MVSVNRRDIMMNVQGRKKHMTSAQIIIFGFMVVIFMGALLLMLPISTKGPGGAPFLDALFTSTSAVCVTGLIVHDTGDLLDGIWPVCDHFADSGRRYGRSDCGCGRGYGVWKKNRPEGTKYHAGCYFCTQGRRDRPFYGLYPQRYVYR